MPCLLIDRRDINWSVLSLLSEVCGINISSAGIRQAHTHMCLSIFCLNLCVQGHYCSMYLFLHFVTAWTICLRSLHISSLVVLCSSSNSAMLRILPFGFLCLSVFLFFVFGCFASLSTLVSTSLSATHFFEVLGSVGDAGEGSRESTESHARNPAPDLPLPF